MRHLLLSLVLITTACGKESSDDGVSFTAASGASDVVGVWKMKSVTLASGSQEFAISGLNKRRFKADGTFTAELENFTLSMFGRNVLANCTSYSNGEIKFDDDTTLFRKVAVATISGECNEAAGTVTSNDGGAITLERGGSDLKLTQDFTYQDETGNSKTDKVVLTFNKTDDDVWDGSGLDDAFTGTWTLERLFFASTSTCTGNVGPAELSFSGSMKTTFTDTSYTRTESGFAVGGTPCSGIDAGTLTPGKLVIGFNQTSASHSCVADAPDVGTTHEERDFVTSTGIYVSFLDKAEDDPDCPGNVYRWQMISLMEKS